MMSYPNPNFWKNKKVFLTGHTGFKGSWLSLWLQMLQAEVFGYALAPPTEPNLYSLANIAQSITHFQGDIRNFEQLKKIILSIQPDIIIHLAAQSLVYHSYQHPIETYATNVMGTVHVLEAARQCKNVKVIINVTSDKCYENKGQNKSYQENEAMGGYDPYSNSKGCAELVSAAYRNSFFNPATFVEHGKALASVRAGNVIGGGDWGENRLIPDLIKAFNQNQCAIIRNPKAIRPWQHVLEPLSGYLLLAEKLWEAPSIYAEGWNFGPLEQDMQTVEAVVKQMAILWGEQATWEAQSTHFPYETQILKLDISKAQNKLSWQPRWSLKKGLETVVAWYKAWKKGQNVQKITLQQIEEYQVCL